ncbi:DEKNAAC100824 [Brettanomyces naardenensis]|uniref:DEKNAAC100824 n=1 Tax=Brettanomyces naardenensis TaxID=13370 RepID=A0A448YF69_BRENA|nr:DEKNAAC100824 [Brettanomyces naardenensis]
MPYLGPRSFETTPLTTNNLAYLNDKLEERSATTASMPTDKITVAANSSCSSSSRGRTTTRSSPDSLSFASSSAKGEEDFSVSTPLSSISSSNSYETLRSPLAESNYSVSNTVVRSNSQQDTRTIVGDDEENRTVVSGETSRRLRAVSTARSEQARSSIVSVESASRSPSPPPSLIRKKSGQLLKSSLKLPSLARSRSMPNTKSVRFAPHLEDVKFFRKTEEPTAVSGNSSPISSPSHSLRPVWDWDVSPSSSDDDDEEGPDYTYEEAEHWEIIKNDCPQAPNSLNFARLRTGNAVILESVKLNSLKTALIGFVFVKNLSYEKRIVVRLTTDDWKTYIEIDNANYISSNHIFRYSDSESNYDKFSFIIKLDALCSVNSLLDIKFCIEYTVGDRTYWDNNGGKNFNVVQRKVRKSLSSSPPNSVLRAASSRNPPTMELDDVGFRLKANNNFNDSFKTSQKFVFHPKNSRNYLMKKIRSESSLSSISTPRSLVKPAFPKLQTPSSVMGIRRKSTASKSAAASPRMRSDGFEDVEDYYDYKQIVKNFCFYVSGAATNNYFNYKKPAEVSHDTANDVPSFCLS